MGTWHTGSVSQALGQPGLSLSPSCVLPTPPAPKLQGLDCEAEPGRPAGATLHPCSLVRFRPSPSCPRSHGILSMSWSQDAQPSVLCETGGSCTVVGSAVTPWCGISGICRPPPELCAAWFSRIAAALQLLSRGRVLGLWTVSRDVSCEVHALLRTCTLTPVHTLRRPLSPCLQWGRWPLCRAGSVDQSIQTRQRRETCRGEPRTELSPSRRSEQRRLLPQREAPRAQDPRVPPSGSCFALLAVQLALLHKLLTLQFSLAATKWRESQHPGPQSTGLPFLGQKQSPPCRSDWRYQLPGCPRGGSAAKPRLSRKDCRDGGAGGRRPALPGESQERPLTGSSASGRPSCGFQARIPVFSPCSFRPRLPAPLLLRPVCP